ncbi:MAG: RNA polymerase subunit sigma-70 [Acidobacteria bacterium]|nr:RNA polymerase subunit sigma-70 [Acidobacteriota bacterium]
MPMEHNATQLLIAWDNGDEEALAKLVPLVQKELHRLACLYLSRERPNHSLQPTELVDLAYLNLLIWKPVGLKNRSHFIGIVARLMRNVLVDHGVEFRRRGIRISLTEADKEAQEVWAEIIALDDALIDLGKLDPSKLQLAELRYFGGLTMKEVSEALDKPLRTLEREWEFTKAWLKCELDRRQKDES